jgi:trimeric autotransporter adhesin
MHKAIIFMLCIYNVGIIKAQNVQTATNGLYHNPTTGTTVRTVGLGGTLTQNTTVDIGSTFTFGFKKGTSNYFSVLNNGNVGISTIGPTEKLDVTGNIKFSGALMPGGQTGTSGYILTSGGTGTPIWTAPGGIISNTAWGLQGNAGTVPGINFIGTIDDQDIILKRGSVLSGLLKNSNKNTSFGVFSLANGLTGGTNNTAFGHSALSANTSLNNTAIGAEALMNNTSFENTAIGYQAMKLSTASLQNTAVGAYSLYNAGTAANANSAFGYTSLTSVTTGKCNQSFGYQAIAGVTTGNNNTAVGFNTGNGIITGSGNVIIGSCIKNLPATLSNTIILGAGGTPDNANSGLIRVYIDATGNTGLGTTTPQNKLEITHGTVGNSGLRFTNLTSSDAATVSSGKVLSVNANGDVILEVAGGGSSADGSETKVTAGTNVTITGNGTVATPYVVNSGNTYWNPSPIDANSIINSNTANVIIGTNITTLPTGYKLYVADGILTEKIKVALKTSTNWADYVFRKDYKLKPLADVEKFIELNKHLPGVKSAETLVKEGGIDIAQTLAKQMEKIEELTLYMIDLNKKIEQLQKENGTLKNRLTTINHK